MPRGVCLAPRVLYSLKANCVPLTLRQIRTVVGHGEPTPIDITMAIVEAAKQPHADVARVHRMARGDEEATREVMDAHLDPLFCFVRRRIGGSIEDAEEIAQDTLLTACEIGLTYDGCCSVMTWLCSLARLRISDFLTREGRQKRIPKEMLVRIDDDSRNALRLAQDPDADLEQIVDRMDRVKMVQVLLDTLTPEQREAMTMRYVEEFSVAEIARIMGRSEKAVERLLERAKEKPRKEMLRWLGEVEFRMLCLSLLTI